jgi:hypothetical protein
VRHSWKAALKWLVGPASRPSWCLDVKWLFGLASVISIIAAGAVYSASKLTEQQPATGVFSGVVGYFFEEDDVSIENFHEIQPQATANPDADFTFIDGVTLPVKGRELEGLSYDEAVELVIGRTAEILYSDGRDAAEQYIEETSEEGSEEEDEEGGLDPLSVLLILTQDNHDAVHSILTFALIAVLVTAVPVVFFSTRFGRLGSPGVLLAVSIAPFAVLWLIAKQVTNDASEDGVEGALAEALSPTAGDVSSDFLRLLILGVALVVVAVAGHIAFAVWHRFRPRPTPALTDEEATPSGGDEPTAIGPGVVPQP